MSDLSVAPLRHGLAALALTMCFGASLSWAQAEEDPLSLVKARGSLEVAVYDSFPPYSYKATDGRPAGVDVDIGRALAEKLGLQSKTRLFPAGENMGDDLRNNIWKGAILGGGVADVMLHVAADPQFAAREDKAAFFGAYFHEAVSVVYHPKKIEAFESPLALTGHKVGVEIDSISDYYMSGAFNGRLRTVAVRHATLSEAVAAFKSGAVDALMAPRGELQGLMKSAQVGDLTYKQQELVGMFRTSWDIGMAVKRNDNTSLRDALAKALEELRAEGRLAAIFKAHGIEYAAPAAQLAGSP
ncbi:MAG: substrate-binding periplasmic protein [Panacagrimonas sp.]